MRIRVLAVLVLLFIISSTSTSSAYLQTQTNYVLAQTASPSERFLPGFVYDPVNDRIMMFGGGNDNDVYDDTWVLNSTTGDWTELVLDSSPVHRSSTVMVYDSADEVIILFGGYNGTQWDSDTWIFDCNTETWTEVTPAHSPYGRGSHAMVYDSINDKVLLFSGYGSTGANVADTWSYDYNTNSWEEMNPSTSPGRRYGAGCIFDQANEIMIIFGGNSQGHYSDTWRYNYATNTWTEFSPTENPGALKWSAMAYDSVNQKSILFGGDIAYPIVSNSTWIFDSANGQWEEREPTLAPMHREAFGFTFDPVNKKAILFGGTEGARVFYNDTWTYDYETNTWTEFEQVPDTTPSEMGPLVLVTVIIFGVAALIIVVACIKKRYSVA